MRKNIFLLIMICIPFFATAQQQSLSGIVISDQGTPVQYATAALMEPVDSTLSFFGFTNETGNFEIKNVKAGKYVLQISYIGLETYDSLIAIPISGTGDLGIFILKTQINTLDAVDVKGERTPILMKGDTLEYNASSFKTQPDASAEDLLKKLPGVEVQSDGSIKAQGETVDHVYVDGKEFFNSDPTVATKNLPADAIDKVQVYDKASEEAEFTGITDGSRSKTINLVLKDDKKSMWLGEAKGGYGTDDRYQANAKVMRFTKNDQIAGLAMLNNVNQFGFNINDFFDFNGGFGSMMSGHGFRFQTGDSNIPLNFGQPVDGQITSGGLGLNFTHEAVPGNRFNISYLGSGYQKELIQQSYTENYTEGFNYTTDENSDEITDNYYHRVNFNIRNKPDSMQNLIVAGGISMGYGDQTGDYFTENFSSDSLTNDLTSATFQNSNSLNGNGELTYIHKLNTQWRFLKFYGTADVSRSLTETEWNNLTNFYDTGTSLTDNEFQNGNNQKLTYEGTFTALRRLKNGYYIEPSLGGGGANEQLNREQGLSGFDESLIDSLSPSFTRTNIYLQPGIAFKFSSKNTNWKLTLQGEGLMMQNTLNDIADSSTLHAYLIPQFSFDKKIKEGRHIGFFVNTYINAPEAEQLLPVVNTVNPLSLYTGNIDLKPEYVSTLMMHYMLFDQFSFTSLFTRLSATYTKNKINYYKIINPDLSESLTLVNTPADYNAMASADFSTPIRPLKINFNLNLSENFDRGINYVNGTENAINAFTHDVGISFDNRKKTKLDVSIGGEIKYTQATYSIETTQNSNYLTNSLTASLSYDPAKTWHITFNANLDQYKAEGFDEPTVVPLLTAGVTRFVFPANRGSIGIYAYDLLDKNTGVTQSSAYNYLQKTVTNSIGRYFMLTLKYRINKADDSNSNMSIDIRTGH